MTIHQTIEFRAPADTIYSALTQSEIFAEVTGAPADIAIEAGGAFSCFAGQITGRQVELTPHSRIVQAWRAGPWAESNYSIVRIEIHQTGDATTVELTHTGYPEEGKDHLDAGWHKMYWQPLRAYVEQ